MVDTLPYAVFKIVGFKNSRLVLREIMSSSASVVDVVVVVVGDVTFVPHSHHDWMMRLFAV